MRKILWSLSVAAVLLVVAGAGLLHVVLDPNIFKPQLMTAVREATGRELRIPGDLHLDFSPTLTLTTGPLELGNAPGFDGPWLTLRNLQLKVRLEPLLQRRLEVVAMDVDGPDLHLARNASGHSNWEDLAAAGAPPTTSGADTPEAGAAASVLRDRRIPLLAGLIVDGLQVRDAAVHWQDARSGVHADVRGFGLDVRHFVFGEPFAIRTEARMESGKLAATMDVSGRVVLDFDKAELTDARLNGELRAPFLKTPEHIQMSAALLAGNGTLREVRLQGLGLNARLDCTVRTAAAQGRMELAPCSPREVMTRLNAGELPSPLSTVARIGGSLNWSADRKQVEMANMVLAVDNATMRGSASATLERAPKVRFDLALDALAGDRFLAESGRDLGPAGTQQLTHSRTHVPRDVDAQGTLRVGHLSLRGLQATDAACAIRISGSTVWLENVHARMYGGTLEGGAVLDTRAETPVLAATHHLSGVQVGPLLRDLRGRELITGTLHARGSLRAQLGIMPRFLETLDGSTALRVENGVLLGINIPARVRGELRRLRGSAPDAPEPEQTRFDFITATVRSTAGVLTSPDASMVAPRFQISGSCQTRLATQTLDARAVLYLRGSEGALDSGILGLKSIPVHVAGTWARPEVSLDMAGVLKGLGASGGKAVRGVVEGVGSGLNEGVKTLLKLF